jgi:hypothetical protein
MAHVFAAHDEGPRPNAELSEAERGLFDNLIILCAICHTTIDKAEVDYPASRILRWKREHGEHLSRIFTAIRHTNRSEVRAVIAPLLAENGAIHEEYNPDHDYRVDPESESAAKWKDHRTRPTTTVPCRSNSGLQPGA